MSERQELIDEAEHHLERTLVLSGVGYEQQLMRRLIKALKTPQEPSTGVRFDAKSSCYCMSSFDGEGDGACPVHRESAPSPDHEKLIEEAADEYVIGMLGLSTQEDLKRAFFAGTHFATPAKAVDEATLTNLILGKTATQAAKDIKRYLEA